MYKKICSSKLIERSADQVPLILFSIYASYFFFIEESIAFLTVYETRDLIRSINWFLGWPILHGPELSGAGYTPGPFFYLLSNIGLFFSKSWWGVYYLKCLLGAAAGVLAFLFGKKISGVVCGLWIGFLYLTSRDLYMSYAIDWNASFQSFFSVLSLGLLICAMTQEKSKKTLYVFFLVSGLNCQIHGSFVVFLPTAFFLNYSSQLGSWNRYSIRTMCTGVMLFILPSLPFILWLFFGEHLMPHSQPPRLEIYWKLLDFFRHNFESGAQGLKESRVLLGDIEIFSRPFLSNIFIKYTFVATGLMILIMKVTNTHFQTLWIKRAFLSFGTVTILYLPVILSNMSARYYYHWQITYIFMFGLVSYNLAKDFSKRFLNKVSIQYRRLLLFLLLATCAVAGCIIHKKDVTGRYRYHSRPISAESVGHEIFVSVPQAEIICNKIYEQTGWSSDTIIRNIFSVRLDNGWDISSICNFELGTKTHTKKKYAPSAVHGYFLFAHVETVGDSMDWKSWFLEQVLPPEIRRAIDNGKLEFLPRIDAKGLILLPYVVNDIYALPFEMHNTGYGYRSDPRENWLQSLNFSDDSNVIVDNNSVIFYINKCQFGQKNCRLAVEVSEIEKNKTPEEMTTVKIEIAGTPLSQRAWYLHPDLAMALYDIKLRYVCSDQKVQEIAIAMQVGNYYIEQSRLNPFFVTPFERVLNLSCNGGLKKIGLSIGAIKGFDNINHFSEDQFEKWVELDLN